MTFLVEYEQSEHEWLAAVFLKGIPPCACFVHIKLKTNEKLMLQNVAAFDNILVSLILLHFRFLGIVTYPTRGEWVTASTIFYHEHKSSYIENPATSKSTIQLNIILH